MAAVVILVSRINLRAVLRWPILVLGAAARAMAQRLIPAAAAARAAMSEQSSTLQARPIRMRWALQEQQEQQERAVRLAVLEDLALSK